MTVRVATPPAARRRIADHKAASWRKRQPIEVEAFQRLLGAEGRSPQARGQLALLASGDFVLDQQREELGVGELAVDGLAVAGIERVEDAGQAQLLELR